MFYKKLFYFDIETVGQYKNIDQLKKNDLRGYELFKKKWDNNPWMQERNGDLEKAYLENSPIFTPYGKIVCISFGYYHDKNPQGYTVSSIYGDDEKEIIIKFAELLNKVIKKGMMLSGYRIKSFDIPWVVHKLNKYGLELPKLVDIYGKKPWELNAFDLADEWKQSFKYYVSFDEVAYELGVDSPKDDIDGSQVHKVYWEDGDLNRIRLYCEKDVISCLRVAKKMLKYKIV
ncbi:MAG: ribonuclease H-like domain-containing protein [bacterium]